MVNRQTDLIKDILQRLTEALGNLPADVVRKVEMDVRRDWAGTERFVAYANEVKKDRNSRIHRAFLQGVRLREIARNEGITERRTRQILKQPRV